MTAVYCHVFRQGSWLVTHAFEAPSVVKIGRLKTAHVVLDGHEVARQHCVLEIGADGRGMVVDLGSEAGTMVDDRLTDRAPLRPKTTIRIGSFAVVVTPNLRPPTAPQPIVQRRPRWLW